MTQIRKSERGQALVLIVFAIVGLIGLTAISIDGGNAYLDRRHAQGAADTAALAAALTKIRGGDWAAAGLGRAASNGYDNNLSTNTVEIYNPPISGPYSGDSNYIQVFITSHVETFFAPIVGIDQITNKVEAVARAKPGTNEPMYGGNAVVGLDPNGCAAVTYNGAADMTLIGSGIYVNSSCSDENNGAFSNNSSSPHTLTAPCLQAVGQITYTSGKVDVPQDCLTEGAPRLDNPVEENIDCGEQVATQTGNTLSPGNWDGAFPPNGVANLESGVYCVSNGNFQVNGGDELHGHGVTISIRDGFVKWNGGALIDLQAPTTGPYAGLLLSLPSTNSSPVTINGNGDSNIVGSIKAPSSEVNIEGGGGAAGLQCQIVGWHVNLNGSSNTIIQYDAGKQYQPPQPPKVELTK